MNFKKIIWILIFPFAFYSCDEDTIEENSIAGCMDDLASNYNADAETAAPCIYNASDVLVNNPWQIASATAVFSGTELDLLEHTDLIPACTLDNLFMFDQNNFVTMEDNIILCENGEESVLDLSGNWTIEGNVLTIENGSEVYVLTVDNLTATSMDLLFDYNFDVSGTIFPIPAKIILIQS